MKQFERQFNEFSDLVIWIQDSSGNLLEQALLVRQLKDLLNVSMRTRLFLCKKEAFQEFLWIQVFDLFVVTTFVHCRLVRHFF